MSKTTILLVGILVGMLTTIVAMTVVHQIVPMGYGWNHLKGERYDMDDMMRGDLPRGERPVPGVTDTGVQSGIQDDGRMMPPSSRPMTGKLKADVFTGKLESVDTGCFADGECFIMVDGKHVRAIMGWSQDVVGKVEGVDGFGDLEKHIGEYVEVYAQDLMATENMFTLYGSEGFYIKLLGKTAPKPEVN